MSIIKKTIRFVIRNLLLVIGIVFIVPLFWIMDDKNTIKDAFNEYLCCFYLFKER